MGEEATKPSTAEIIYGKKYNEDSPAPQKPNQSGESAADKIYPHLKKNGENRETTTPKQPMAPSGELVEFIKSKESFQSLPYNDQSGHATIGYGRKLHNGPVTPEDIGKYKEGLTEEKALTMLAEDVKTASDAVNRLVKVPLTQSQHDAVTSFTYNVGQDRLAKSTFLKKLNKGDYKAASEEMPRWKYTQGKVSNGLIKRRAEEMEMFYKKGGK